MRDDQRQRRAQHFDDELLMTRKLHPRLQRGATLIEILVSLVILMLGLLGLIGVMIQSQRAQQESYQRMQALLLVQDMTARINGNRAAADCYVQASALGTGNAATPVLGACTYGLATSQGARAAQDLAEWKDLLLGSAEVSSGNKVGGILGARGCVTKDVDGVFQVSVVWQGMQAAGAPPAGIACGTNQYGDEALRRAVSITVVPPNAS
jgi:type IV pilus assembly protein PilV